MAKKYLDDNGLLYLWGKIKAAFVGDINYDSSTGYVTKTKNGSTSNVVAIPTGVSPSSTTPKMDGTASTGSESAFARGDHVHPTDTSRASSSHTHGAITNDGLVSSSSGLGGFKDIAVNDHIMLASAGTGKICAANLTFDGSTTTQALTKKGTWATFNNYTHPAYTANSAAAVKVGNDATGHVVIGSALTASDVGAVPTSRTVNSKALSSNITLYATDIELSSSKNTTVSTAIVNITTDLNGKVDSSAVGQADGVCPLDSNGVVDSSYLPSYVDDVIEAYARSGQTALSQNWLATGSASGTVIVPEAGKIYVLMADSGDYSANTQFRWGGTAYVKLNDGGVSSITNAEIDTIVAS